MTRINPDGTYSQEYMKDVYNTGLLRPYTLCFTDGKYAMITDEVQATSYEHALSQNKRPDWYLYHCYRSNRV